MMVYKFEKSDELVECEGLYGKQFDMGNVYFEKEE